MAFEKDEVLSDNTHIKLCKQCKNCRHWGNNSEDYRSNQYDKAYCDMYPFPNRKPQEIMDNVNFCAYKEVK